VTASGTLGRMGKARKKKAKSMDLPNPLVVDEGEFTDVVRKMVNTPPEPLEKIVKRRRKNPETDPRYLPVFDFGKKIRVEKKKD
jgi:hypothetical protein